jgi:hypothetical protein
MPRFENDRVDFVLTKRLVLFGGRELQHTLGPRGRRAIKSEDDIVGEVISDTARPEADALAAQIPEIACFVRASASSCKLKATRLVAVEAALGPFSKVMRATDALNISNRS